MHVNEVCVWRIKIEGELRDKEEGFSIQEKKRTGYEMATRKFVILIRNLTYHDI
ncbi:MAG: hypothetical protein N2Z72_04930 [Bacteroidales bacterium]|nr:hypothetical protein [Bacteroidales bacterium]